MRSYNLYSLQVDDVVPSSPVCDAEPYLEALLEQVQEFVGIERTVTTPTPIVVPTSTIVPIPIAVPSFVTLHRVPPRGSQKVETPTRRSRIKKFLENLRRLRDKFSRASREPVTLSRGLVPERDENAEITEKRYVDLFA